MARAVQNGQLLYKQIYHFVMNQIERKEWQAHDKLPSVRSLANQFNVHRLTVLKAYQLLKKEGKIYVKDKTGYFVQPQITKDYEYSQNPIIATYTQKNHLSEIHKASVTYNFSQALIDPNLLPNHFFSDYVKNVFDLYPKVLATYSTVQGDEELREVLAEYFEKQFKTHLTKDHLLITSGSQQAIHLVSEAFIKPGDIVLFERPSYSAAIDIFQAQGARIITIDICENGYDLEKLESMMKKYKPRLFYTNPTFHNPTGYIISAEQRKGLVELAEQYRCLIVEDDAYHDIYYEQPPPLPIYTYDTAGTVIYVRSFCKYISPGLRVATIICQPSIMPILLTSKSLIDNGSPLLNQKIFLHYFSSLRLHQHLEKLRIALQIRKEMMEEELVKTDWKWRSPQGGLSLWVHLPEYLSIELLLSKSLHHSISFVPGVVCDPLKQESHWIRLSYSYENEKKLKDGMKQFVGLAKRLEEDRNLKLNKL